MGRAGRACLGAVGLLAGAFPGFAVAPGEQLERCPACHGTEGQSEIENVPSLGGQLAGYTLIQLFMFRERLRVSEPISARAKELSDDDLRSLADPIAATPPPKPPADPGDPVRLEKARALTN